MWTKKGDGVEFYRLRVTLCKEASGDTVGDEYGLFKGPQGWTLSLIPQLPVGLLSPLPPLGDFRSHRQRQSQEAIEEHGIGELLCVFLSVSVCQTASLCTSL